MIRRLVGTAHAAGALVTTAPLAAAADPILPLSEVRTGMMGEARTVVTGTTIERFPVRVLGVQRLGATPGGTLILVRAEGPLITPIGVAEGMSGSPVYITGPDGVQRVIGAIAFGTGDEGGLVVGVTPIESMISSARLGGVPLGARENARPSAAAPALPIRRATLVDGRAAALRWERRHPERQVLGALVVRRGARVEVLEVELHPRPPTTGPYPHRSRTRPPTLSVAPRKTSRTRLGL